jgi:hypothetical protein
VVEGTGLENRHTGEPGIESSNLSLSVLSLCVAPLFRALPDVGVPSCPTQRCYFSLLLRVVIHGRMMEKTMAKRNDVAQSIVLAP